MAAAPSYKNPPSLTKDKTYQQWKNEVNMWQLVTDLDKKKRGLALALSLQGKPREVALELNPADLNVDEGVDKLIAELDKLFEKDKVDQAYSAYTVFDKFQRDQSMEMSDYIIEFEQRYNKCKRHEMVLPDAILAFKLLDNAGLTQNYRQLALTACNDLKFDTMKSALNRIFASKIHDDSAGQDQVVSVKEESAFISERYFDRGRSGKRSFPRNRNDRSTNSRKNQSRMNPTINGSVSRCRICDSKFHWVRDCPHKTQDVYQTEEQEDETVHITLLTASHQDLNPQTVFVAEAFNAAVIDTACSKTVCGSKWLHEFVDSLNSEYEQITCSDSNVPFKFGDGKTVYSFQKVKFPAKIGSKQCFIETEVVDCEIPLLLSKESLKRAHTVLDLENDKVTMFGQAIEVNLTSSGHYCINIKDNNFSHQNVAQSEEVLCIDTKLPLKRKKEILLKLHKQFGHASQEKLLSLLQSAGNVDSHVKTLLNEICSRCVVCHKFKHPKSKPVVAFSHANDFNQIVAMDLHEIDHNFYYLHIIDLFSRLSAAAIIRSKDPRVIVDKFMQIWVSVYGAPEVGVYTDNGGEFNSQIFRDMAENLNMSVKKWYEKVKKTLLQCGGRVSKVDPAVFYWRNENGLCGVLTVHVDDFLWAGIHSFEKNVIEKVRDLFKVGREESESFKYIGLGLQQNGDRIILSQKHYVNNLKTVPIDNQRAKTSPLTPSEKTLLRSKVGQLLWLSKQTRPDIAFDIANISSRLKNSTIEDLKTVNKLIKKVQHEQISLCFKDLGPHMEIVVFSDASFGNLPDGGSQGGYIIFLMGKDGDINPITWQSKKIRRVVRSTIASETLALADGVDCAVSLSILCNELLNDDTTNIAIKCFIDNKDLYHALYSDKQVVERRLRLDISALKQSIQNKEISGVDWTPTNKQIANVLTKHGASGHDIMYCLERGHLDLE